MPIARSPASTAGPAGIKPAAVLFRPDGHVGFRASLADEAGIDALDTHIGSYLIPALPISGVLPTPGAGARRAAYRRVANDFSVARSICSRCRGVLRPTLG
jgi:hypothetical protein